MRVIQPGGASVIQVGQRAFLPVSGALRRRAAWREFDFARVGRVRPRITQLHEFTRGVGVDL